LFKSAFWTRVAEVVAAGVILIILEALLLKWGVVDVVGSLYCWIVHIARGDAVNWRC
jgi:hypothetical protein